MNRLFIIGNLTKAPELRTTQAGKQVCSFTVAVNRRKDKNGQQETDFFRVAAWNQLAENCSKYLAKGRKVAVIGSVSVSTFQGNDGKTYAQMDVVANDVEFLTPKGEIMQGVADAAGVPKAEPARDPQTGFEMVQEDLPF